MTRNNETTSYRKKGLSVFLTVLMILSVVAMSAAFVAPVAAQTDDLSNGGTTTITIGADTTQDVTFDATMDAQGNTDTITIDISEAVEAGVEVTGVNSISGTNVDDTSGSATVDDGEVEFSLEDDGTRIDGNTVTVTLAIDTDEASIASDLEYTIESEDGEDSTTAEFDIDSNADVDIDDGQKSDAPIASLTYTTVDEGADFTDTDVRLVITGASDGEVYNDTVNNVGASPLDLDDPLTSTQDVTANIVSDANPSLIYATDTTSVAVADESVDAGNVEGSIFWEGQTVAIDTGAGASVDVQLREVTDYSEGDPSASSLVDELTTDDGGILIIDTDGLDDADYVLRETGGDWFDGTDFSGASHSDAVMFEVATQTLDVEFDEAEILEDESVDIEFDSNRGTYDIWIQVDDLDQDEIEDIFVNNGDFDDSGYVDLTSIDAGEWVTLEDVTDGDYTVDFDGIDTGDYDLNFMVPDTGVMDNAEISVGEAPDEDMAFGSSTYESVSGDWAVIDVQFDQLDEGWLFVGDEDSGYMAAAHIDNPEEEENVLVGFNTYNADTPDEAFVVLGDDTDAEIDDTRTGDQLNGDWTSDVNSPLPAGEYDLRISPTVYTDDGEVVDEEDVASLLLDERSLDNVRVSTAPAEDADDIEEGYLLEEVMTESSEIAEGDRLVVAVEGTGFYGALAPDEDVTRGNFMTDVTDAANGEITLGIYQENFGVGNQDYFEIDGASDSAYVISDSTNSTLYLVVNTDDIDTNLDRSLDRTWNATFTLGHQFDDAMDDEDDAETISQTFDIAEPEVEFDNVNDEDEVQILHDEEATVSGETNLAPGTEIDLRIRGDGYLITADELEVQSDGSWNATVDTAEDASVGDEVDVEIRHNLLDDGEADGVIVDEIAERPSQDRIDELEDEIADLEDQLANAEGDVSDLEQQLADAESDLADAQSDLADAEADRDGALDELSDAEDEIADLEGQLSDANDEISQLEDDLADAEADDDDDEQPAFGPIAALFALLAGGALIARRRL